MANLTRRILIGMGFHLLVACGTDGPDVLQHTRIANLPLYFTASGGSLGEGAIYKIQSLKKGEQSRAELVLDGLDFPTGISVDTKGGVYFTETLPTPRGKLKYIKPDASVATLVLDELHNPTGVAVDSFDRFYLTERDNNQLRTLNIAGEFSITAQNNFSSPRDVHIDAGDNIYITQLDTDSISTTDLEGNLQPVAEAIANPFGVTTDNAGNVFALANNTGGEDGQILQIISPSLTEPLVNDLVNPSAITFNNAHGFFFVEGAPANRISLYDQKTKTVTIIVNSETNLYGLSMSK